MRLVPKYLLPLMIITIQSLNLEIIDTLSTTSGPVIQGSTILGSKQLNGNPNESFTIMQASENQEANSDSPAQTSDSEASTSNTNPTTSESADTSQQSNDSQAGNPETSQSSEGQASSTDSSTQGTTTESNPSAASTESPNSGTGSDTPSSSNSTEGGSSSEPSPATEDPASSTDPTSPSQNSSNPSTEVPESSNSSQPENPSQPSNASQPDNSSNPDTPPAPQQPVLGLKFISVSATVTFTQQTFIGSEFEAKVGIYNLNTDSIDSNNSHSNISLSLDHNSLTGVSLVQVQSGVATFPGLSIGQIGVYQLTASSDGFDSVTYSENLTVAKWPLYRVEVLVEGNVTSYFEFEVLVKLWTQKDELYLDEETLTLESNLTLIGSKSLQVVNGTARFNVYTEQHGPAWFKASVGDVSGQTELTVEQPVTKITVSKELTQMSNWFNLTIEVLDYDEKNLISLTNVSYTVSIGSAESLYGNPSGVAVNGVVQINNLVIINPGSFAFVATGLDNSGNVISQASTENYVISVDQSNLPVEFHELKDLKIEFSTRTPTAFFSFSIKVFLYNQIKKSYDKTCEAGVVGNTTLHGSTYHETKSGQSVFTVHSKSVGKLNLLITVCDTFSRSDEIEILPLKGKVEVEDHIKEDSNYFNVRIGIYDNSLENIEKENGVYNVTLKLKPEADLSGIKNYPQAYGEWTFQRLSILEKGNFYFEVIVKESETGAEILQLLSDRTYAISPENARVPDDLLVIAEIDTDCYEVVSAYEAFVINATINDQEGQLWKEECNVVINSNMTIYGETSKIAYDGFLQFSVYFKEVGFAKVTILTCDGLTESFEIEVLPYTQHVLITPNIFNDSNYFDVEVEILDGFGESVLDAHGKFNIKLFLIPEGNLTSNSKGLAVKGTKVFNAVTILSPGDYQIGVNITEASGLSPKDNPFVSNESWVITKDNAFIPKSMLQLSYMEVHVGSDPITVFFPFNLTVKLFDQVNSTWLPDCLVNLTSDEEISGETSLVAENGEVQFTIYFTDKGKIKLTILTETGLQHEIQIQVRRQRLQVEPIVKKFEDSHYINITVDVLNNEMTKIESENGNYSVTLFTTPKVKLHGNLTQICNSGVCHFTGISVLANSTVRFGATVLELESESVSAPEGYSELTYTIDNDHAHIFLHQIQLHLSESPVEYVNSELNVLLLDINKDLYMEDKRVEIKSSGNYNGPSHLDVVQGNSSFKFYYNQVGDQEIEVSTKYKKRDVGFKVEARMNYPLLVLIVMFWALVIFTVVFWINDKDRIDEENASFGFRMYCPLLILTDSGENHLRIITIFRVFASQFMMFTLIGIFYNKEVLDAPLAEDGIDAYGLEDWYQGFIVLLISQCFSCPVGFLHYAYMGNKALGKMIIGISVMIMAVSIVFSVWTITEFSAKYYLFWVVTYAIYGLIELVLIHTLFGAFFFCFFFKPEVVQPSAMLSSKSNDMRRPFLSKGDQKNSLSPDDIPLKPRAPRVSVLLRK